MGKTAFVFPGQGSASVGMGRDIVAASPAAAAVWAEVTAAVPDLERRCFEGPLDELVETANAQPAIFAVDCACLAALQDAGFDPDIVAGHSLGEYAALVAAGALSLQDALPLVRARAEAMQAACARPGSMLAVTGLPDEQVAALVAAWDGAGGVEHDGPPGDGRAGLACRAAQPDQGRRSVGAVGGSDAQCRRGYVRRSRARPYAARADSAHRAEARRPAATTERRGRRVAGQDDCGAARPGVGGVPW